MTQVDPDSGELLDEISLGDHFREDSDVEPKELTLAYAQNNSIKGTHREFSLFDEIYLFYTLKSFNLKALRSKQQPEYRIDLTYLDPKPVRSFKLAWKWLLRGIIACAAAVAVVYFRNLPALSFAEQAILPVTLLLGTAGMLMLMLFYYKSHNLIAYRSYVGRVPLVVLSHKGRQKDYKKFIKAIEDGIQKAQNRSGITMRTRLVGEMKDVRRLKDLGVISEKVYNRAQTKIFNHEAYQK